MALGSAVITFGDLNLPSAGKDPHPHSILRRLESTEHFGRKFMVVVISIPTWSSEIFSVL